MNEQPKTDAPQKDRPQWSDAEVRRVSRFFELLIQIDQRMKGRKRNEQPLD